MSRALGYHLVKSAYGQWLPGDARGHWSTAWDAELGYVEPHRLHPGDPVRRRMAAERMKHPPTLLDDEMIDAVATAVADCAAASDWRVAAATIERTHMHLLLTATTRDVERTAKWISQQTTKAMHRDTAFAGPVWCEGRWLEYVFDESHWENLRRYIERHNVRRGLPATPWTWVGIDAVNKAGHGMPGPKCRAARTGNAARHGPAIPSPDLCRGTAALSVNMAFLWSGGRDDQK